MMQNLQLQSPEHNNALSQLSDEQLLLMYRKTGDRELFAQLVYRYERELYAYLSRYLGDRQRAEDTFQATFLQVHLKCDSFEAGRKFRPWLYTIATRQAIDNRRRNKRHRMVSLDAPQQNQADDVSRLVESLQSNEESPTQAALASERAATIRNHLSRLPESMHALVHLVYYQGMKYREASEVLNIPVGTIKSRLHSAIHRLSEILETTYQED